MRKRSRRTKAPDAIEVDLPPADPDEIERIIPADSAAGGRHADEQLATLDSER
ncbi:MAG: hypothetical protein ACR2F6_14945 [Mycobacteriales bacterium]